MILINQIKKVFINKNNGNKPFKIPNLINIHGNLQPRETL